MAGFRRSDRVVVMMAAAPKERVVVTREECFGEECLEVARRGDVGLKPSRIAPSGAVQKDATLIFSLTNKIARLYDISPKLEDFD